MTYAQAKLCLPPKAKFHSAEPEGELYFVGKTQWWLIPQDDGTWDCTRRVL
jgi:hypothetical protein